MVKLKLLNSLAGFVDLGLDELILIAVSIDDKMGLKDDP